MESLLEQPRPHVPVRATVADAAQVSGQALAVQPPGQLDSSQHGSLGLAATTTAGTDMGFNREAAGTLNPMTTGDKTYYNAPTTLTLPALANGVTKAGGEGCLGLLVEPSRT
ncbi:hypothetical protein ACF08B_22100 [Streptomyces sp. NPDC015139]|uniref:hypothetical protein n=1 Tax=Streptomyces sp. NPDC015139 TaxID=3364942 RepID=UPI0036F56B2D